MYRSDSNESFIIDAGVLIDLQKSSPSLLGLLSARFGRLYIASVVLDEVNGFSKRDCETHGICIVEPDYAQVADAALLVGALSLEDAICLVLARDNGWTCITNDRCLRRECRAAGVDALWGLEAIALLVKRGAITPTEAKEAAIRIHNANPRFITEDILKRFFERISKMA